MPELQLHCQQLQEFLRWKKLLLNSAVILSMRAFPCSVPINTVFTSRVETCCSVALAFRISSGLEGIEIIFPSGDCIVIACGVVLTTTTLLLNFVKLILDIVILLLFSINAGTGKFTPTFPTFFVLRKNFRKPIKSFLS